MTDKNKDVTREDDIRLQVVVGITILAIVAMKIINQDISRRSIVNNFYIIDDKIIPFRFR